MRSLQAASIAALSSAGTKANVFHAILLTARSGCRRCPEQHGQSEPQLVTFFQEDPRDLREQHFLLGRCRWWTGRAVFLKRFVCFHHQKITKARDREPAGLDRNTPLVDRGGAGRFGICRFGLFAQWNEGPGKIHVSHQESDGRHGEYLTTEETIFPECSSDDDPTAKSSTFPLRQIFELTHHAHRAPSFV